MEPGHPVVVRRRRGAAGGTFYQAEDGIRYSGVTGVQTCALPIYEDEAIRLADDTIYGLSGSIWTRNGARALRVARGIETGVLSVNSNTSVRVATPFGGVKQSGVRRELGPDALDYYTEVKNVYISTEGGKRSSEPWESSGEEG